MCDHQWINLYEVMPPYFTYDGIKVSTVMCQCMKCGKQKSRKVIVHEVGHLFEKEAK